MIDPADQQSPDLTFPYPVLSDDGLTLSVIRIESPGCPTTPVGFEFDGAATYTIVFEVDSRPDGACDASAEYVRTDFVLDSPPTSQDVVLDVSHVQRTA